MITQSIDPHQFVRRARQIKARVPIILSQWGLTPKFKRWRLAQDPETNMVVLFGVLDSQFITMQTSNPCNNYFDPRLLRDLSTELHMQVIGSTEGGLRYAFVLEMGQIDLLDLAADADNSQVEETIGQNKPPEFDNSTLVDDHAQLRQRLANFTENDEAQEGADATDVPDVLLMDEAEFNQSMTNYEINPNPGE